MASAEEFIYYCHICSSERSDAQITPSSTGDICCLVCNNEGFVEKITSHRRPRSAASFRGFERMSSGRGFQFSSANRSYDDAADLFSAALGMPLTNFIQGVFQNALGPMRQGSSFTIRSNMGGGSTSVLTSNFGDSRAATTPEGEGSAGGSEQTVADAPLELFRSMLQSPFDTQTMNQILYYVMENDPNRQGSPPAAKRILETLDTDTLDEEQAKKLETCAICTEDFSAGDKIHWLSKDRTVCGHGFHVDCIVPWLKQHNSCPVCRYELPTDDANYNQQREDLRSRLVEEVQRHVQSTSQPNSGRQSSVDESAPNDSATQGRRPPYTGGRIIQDHNCRVQ
ncbi:zinc C3HC4 type RING finger domain-containing protein [Babesia ovata]|uniref:RING-type E3 ubiquitin transferase n=1 Tax=Babesia ovata TaxID=189622 RepID=A0A2H6KH01_9APIC|nr:zinc C3HC4 type RING finger domain-containing protein [Babesia ovata]GBE62264.1 zinc C3HC4 type RING finger domain-containing protein [Babesia ovata]